MPKARGLGRGLSALIPERTTPSGPLVHGESGGVEWIDVAKIAPNPFQPRRYFSETELAELAESIRIHGVIQPILLRPAEAGYQLIAGERRVRAARLAGLDAVPAVVKALSDREAIEMALVENLQRSDLNPLEESQAYSRLIDEFRWTQEEIGGRVGKSRSHVANYLRLLQLEPEIQAMVADQRVSVAHAKALLSADGPRRLVLAERCAKEGWTVKQLEGAVKRGDAPRIVRAAEDVHLKSIETGLRRRLGTKVTLRGDASRGKIEIPYHSLEELERLLEVFEQDSGPDSGGFVV